MPLGPSTRAKTAAQRKARESPTASPQHVPGAFRTAPRPTPEVAPERIGVQPERLHDSRKFLSINGYLDASSLVNPASIAKAITAISGISGITPRVEKALSHLTIVVAALGTQCAGCERSAEIPDLLEDLKIDLKLDLGGKLETLCKQMEEKLMPQDTTTLTSDRLEETAKSLNVLATGLEAKINKVTSSTEQLANTATTYRDALLRNNPPTQAHGSTRNTDPALNAATSRKARQVLVQLSEIGRASCRERV